MERRLYTGDQRHIGPELLATLTTLMPSMKRNALAGGRIHSDPDPLIVRLLLYTAPHLIGFGFQPGQHDRGGTRGELDMEVIGARLSDDDGCW